MFAQTSESIVSFGDQDRIKLFEKDCASCWVVEQLCAIAGREKDE